MATPSSGQEGRVIAQRLHGGGDRVVAAVTVARLARRGGVASRRIVRTATAGAPCAGLTWPSLPLPHVYNVPSSVTARAWYSPAAMWATRRPSSPCTGLGTRWYLTCCPWPAVEAGSAAVTPHPQGRQGPQRGRKRTQVAVGVVAPSVEAPIAGQGQREGPATGHHLHVRDAAHLETTVSGQRRRQRQRRQQRRTFVGVLRFRLSPTPRAPERPMPHAYTSPSSVTHTVCWSPQDTWATRWPSKADGSMRLGRPFSVFLRRASGRQWQDWPPPRPRGAARRTRGRAAQSGVRPTSTGSRSHRWPPCAFHPPQCGGYLRRGVAGVGNRAAAAERARGGAWAAPRRPSIFRGVVSFGRSMAQP